MKSLIEYTKIGAVGVITVNNPPVNALSIGVPQGILESLEQGIGDPEVMAFVLMGAGSTFIAGADIRELELLLQPGGFTLRDLLPVFEQCSKPVIAAIHGAALGGGLETALGCHFRCAVPHAKFGLPEVTLGLLPGAGGTQRLPRLIGIEPALDMILSGAHIGAEKALSLGLIDEILDGELLPAALEYAGRVVAQNRPLPVISRLPARLSVDSGTDYFNDIRSTLEKKSRGYLAPFLIVDCVEAAVTLPFAGGWAKEDELFRRCVASSQSKALLHLFFAERAAARIPGVDPKTPPRSIKKVAVIGAGTMGGAIAMNFANVGIPVKLLEIDVKQLETGLGVIRKNYEITADKGRITRGQVAERMALLHGTLAYDDLADADLIIEAVFEDMDVKKQIFRKLDAVCKPGAILATNTSTLNVDMIAAATERPGDVIGMHFFTPANVTRLIEIVRGRETTGDVIVSALSVTRKIRKIPVVVGVCFGFVGNRMLEPYMREAVRLILEGATPEQVDGVLTGFGMALGVCSMLDLTGMIDIAYPVRTSRRSDLKHDPGYHALTDKLYELGRFGQKTGRGFYLYNGRERSNDPEIIPLAEKLAAEHGIKRRYISDEEILERCLFTLINEAARILEEGIAYRSGDCDLIWTNGYGFPAWRGGPLQYADEIGLDRVLQALNTYRSCMGEYGAGWFTPSPLLEHCVRDGKKFADFNK